MTDPRDLPDARSRFRELPPPVQLAETVESVDTSRLPEENLDEERDRFLRTAAG